MTNKVEKYEGLWKTYLWLYFLSNSLNSYISNSCRDENYNIITFIRKEDIKKHLPSCLFYSCMSTGSWLFLKNILGAHLAQSRFQFFLKLLMKN